MQKRDHGRPGFGDRIAGKVKLINVARRNKPCESLDLWKGAPENCVIAVLMPRKSCTKWYVVFKTSNGIEDVSRIQKD